MTLIHPDRVYWLDAGVTKTALADYHAEVLPLMGPHVVDRPLALLCRPEGITGPKFFQKHAWKGMSAGIKQVRDLTDNPMTAVEDLDGLIGLAQAGAPVIHAGGSMLASREKPDRIVMNLDPGKNVA